MTPSLERPRGRRKVVPLLLAMVALVAVAGIGLAWVATRPTTSQFCTAAGSIDEVGAETPEAARIRWAGQFSLDVDIEHPDHISGSGDRITAEYRLDDLQPAPGERDGTAFRQIVTVRDEDSVWRVVSANRCERRTSV